jgi:hypothetical protein
MKVFKLRILKNVDKIIYLYDIIFLVVEDEYEYI